MSEAVEPPKFRLGGHTDVPSTHVLGDRSSLLPRFSIVIPTFRRPTLVCDAVRSALAQGGAEIEVVIVDNEQDARHAAAVDRELNAIGDPRIQLYRNAANLGMFGNWNRGLDLARGEWVSILNDDDMLAPGWLDAMRPLLLGDRMVVCATRTFGDDAPAPSRTTLAGRTLDRLEVILTPFARRPKQRDLGSVDLMSGNPVPGLLGALVRRDLMLAQGGYEERVGPTADYRFNFRFWAEHGIYRIDEPLALYRFEDNATMRPAVARAIIAGSHDLRISIVDRLDIARGKRRRLRLLADRQAAALIRDYRLLIGDGFDEQAALADIGMKKASILPHRILVRALRVAWQYQARGLPISLLDMPSPVPN